MVVQTTLKQMIIKEFGSVEIVKLKDLAKKISIISKVRIGKNRDFSDYDEISLNNIDPYGVIYISPNSKQQQPANRHTINSQKLQYGDLVLNQRASKLKVGLVGNNYKRVIVGNNSMIRIRFDDNQIDTARFVQLYLQLPFIQEHLNSLPTCTQNNTRRILNSTQIGELPIPNYIEEQQLVSLQELLHPKMRMLEQLQDIQNNSTKLIQQLQTQILDMAKYNYRSDEIDNPTFSDEDIEKMVQLRDIIAKYI
jgi:hypothetical protein